jgi:hypothetical protein
MLFFQVSHFLGMSKSIMEHLYLTRQYSTITCDIDFF